MKTLIIYDSFFGNTERIARALGDAPGSQKEVKILKVTELKPEHLLGLQLLIVGSPTRGFRPTPAIKNFLKSISKNGLKGVKVAAFDTRIAMSDVDSRILLTLVKIFGYAAEPIADQLQKKGGDLAIPPEGFFVEDSEGPLKQGELERAAEWAKQIITTE
jgi:flavodoxin I